MGAGAYHSLDVSGMLLQHPVIVARVQSYLNELSAAGGSGSWSTWKMKLPPGEQGHG